MEEDINILEELKKDFISLISKKDGFVIERDKREREVRAIEHLIKAYKELEEENKIIKGNYYTLCVDIQMVTSELGFPEDTIIADEMIPMIKENYIEKSLVEEKIEELKRQRRELRLKTYLRREDMLNDDRAIACEIAVLQELLEKRK